MATIARCSARDDSEDKAYHCGRLHLTKIAMLDTRVKPRRPVNRAGTISVNSVTTLDCVVRDYSASGVRLEMANTAAVPAEFALTLEGVAAPRLCKLVWRSQQAVGASFVEGASA